MVYLYYHCLELFQVRICREGETITPFENDLNSIVGRKVNAKIESAYWGLIIAEQKLQSILKNI